MEIEDLPYDVHVEEAEALKSSFLDACEWLDDFGFEFKKTRFGLYKNQIENISEAIGENKSREEIESAFHEHLNAYAEAVEIVRIRSAMEGAEFLTTNNVSRR